MDFYSEPSLLVTALKPDLHFFPFFYIYFYFILNPLSFYYCQPARRVTTRGSRDGGINLIWNIF